MFYQCLLSSRKIYLVTIENSSYNKKLYHYIPIPLSKVYQKDKNAQRQRRGTAGAAACVTQVMAAVTKLLILHATQMVFTLYMEHFPF